MTTAASPTATAQRITSLDTIRGVAVLGILVMNVVSFGLSPAAYFNIDASSPQNWLDWILGGLGEIFFDQKFMGLFSMLFGAGIVLFAERAADKGRRPVLFSLWRNFLLLLIGIAHTLLWDGDILVVYALCAPILIALRKLPVRALLTLGGLAMLVSPVLAIVAQDSVGPAGQGLGEYWGVAGIESDAVGIWLIADFFFRALGMMLIGVAAYRTGFMRGELDDASYSRWLRLGLALGLPLAVGGYVWVAASGFSVDVAAIGSIPNTIATVPLVVAYVSLITLWHRRTESSPLNRRLRAAGRMALTNYLTQTVLGVTILTWGFGTGTLSRAWLVVFVAGVWVLQLWWSTAWLNRHRFGPAEWAWRSATYGRLSR